MHLRLWIHTRGDKISQKRGESLMYVIKERFLNGESASRGLINPRGRSSTLNRWAQLLYLLIYLCIPLCIDLIISWKIQAVNYWGVCRCRRLNYAGADLPGWWSSQVVVWLYVPQREEAVRAANGLLGAGMCRNEASPAPSSSDSHKKVSISLFSFPFSFFFWQVCREKCSSKYPSTLN